MKKENDYKTTLLDTFKAFISICQQHNLHYYGAFGTVLGAVRHKGLIPWDDDIDVYMPREDYKKFLQLRHHIGEQYGIVDKQEDGYFLNFAKFYNKKTTILENELLPFVYGVFIDVFALDEYSEVKANEIKEKEKEYASINKVWLKSQRESSLIEFFHSFSHCKWRNAVKIAFNFFYYRFRKKDTLEAMNKIEEYFSNIQGEYFCRYSVSVEECVTYPKDWFGDGVKLVFEDIEIIVPSKYEEYLSKRYGDFMKLPPVAERKSGHHFYYLNLNQHLSVSEIRREVRAKENSLVSLL